MKSGTLQFSSVCMEKLPSYFSLLDRVFDPKLFAINLYFCSYDKVARILWLMLEIRLQCCLA